MGTLYDLRRTELEDRDSRIFLAPYAPVMVMENGRRVVKPMRYQCRPAGKPAFYSIEEVNVTGQDLHLSTADHLKVGF